MNSNSLNCFTKSYEIAGKMHEGLNLQERFLYAAVYCLRYSAAGRGAERGKRGRRRLGDGRVVWRGKTERNKVGRCCVFLHQVKTNDDCLSGSGAGRLGRL